MVSTVIQLTLTLKMPTAQVVETSVTVNNNTPIQDYVHPDDNSYLSFAVQAGDHLRSRIILGHFGEHLRYCTVLSHHKAPFGSFRCHRCTTKLRT